MDGITKVVLGRLSMSGNVEDGSQAMPWAEMARFGYEIAVVRLKTEKLLMRRKGGA